MRRAGLGLAAIVVLAAVLRFATLGVQSYWFDEAITVHLLRDSLGGMLGAIPDSESTPPLYYVVAWFWSKVFGTGEAGLRALSAVLGVALVPLAYAIALRWSRSTRAGLVAALLVATNPLLIWYSQEARAYSLLVLLAAATLLVLPDALAQTTKGSDPFLARAAPATKGSDPFLAHATKGSDPFLARPLLWWAVFAALSLVTHYFALFVVVPQALWLLRGRGRDAFPAVGAVGLAGLLILPLAVSQAENDGARFIRDLSIGERLIAVPKQLLVGYDAPGEVAGSILAGLLVLVVVWLVVSRAEDDERRAAGQLAAIGLVAVVIPLVLGLVSLDYLITRNVLAALVPLVVAIGVVCGARRAGPAGVVAAVGIGVIGVAMYFGVEQNGRYQRDDWKGISEAVGEPRGPRALLVSPANGSSVLELYMPDARRVPRDVPKLSEIWVVAVAQREPGEVTKPPRPVTPDVLPGGFELVGTRRTDTFSIAHYRTPDGRPVLVDPDILRTLAFNPVPVSTMVEAVDQ